MLQSKVNKDKVIELRKKGLTLQKIGEYFGVSRQRIAQLTGKTNHLKQQFKLENKIIKPKFKPKSKVCNWCNKEKRILEFVTFVKSKDRRPYCKECKEKYLIRKNQKPPKKLNKVDTKIELTPEGINILINNGFARNREEALRYIQ